MKRFEKVQQLGPLTAYAKEGRADQYLVQKLNSSHCFKSYPLREPPIIQISSSSQAIPKQIRLFIISPSDLNFLVGILNKRICELGISYDQSNQSVSYPPIIKIFYLSITTILPSPIISIYTNKGITDFLIKDFETCPFQTFKIIVSMLIQFCKVKQLLCKTSSCSPTSSFIIQ